MSSPQSVRTRPINIAEYETYASQHLPKQAFDYYRSGANDEFTLRENTAAYNRLVIRPRFLIDVSNMDVSTTILGHRVSSPICIAPTAMQKMAHPEGELASARAAAACGALFCLSSLSTTNLEEVGAANPNSLRWFQLYIYKDRNVTIDLIRKAERAGYKAIAITVDTPFIGTREADVRNGFALPRHLALANFEKPKQATEIITDKGLGASGLAEYSMSLFDRSLTWKDVAWVKTQTKLPIILKGVLTKEDALLAVEAGCDGILVSNHGARQVDTVAATIEALPEVVEAVAGRVEVYLDGGVRRGTDVFKALALGARAVFIGRPVLYGLAFAGEQGVKDVWNILNQELTLAMGLCGTPNIKSINKNFLTTKEAMRPKL